MLKEVGIAVAALLFTTQGIAQAYKCQEGGAVVYQQQPCNGGTKLRVVPDPPDPNTRDGRVELAVSKREVFIGMTRDEVIRSWGKPSKNNKSVSSQNTHEQWIYHRGRIGDDQYLYFENGILRSTQSPE